MVEEKKTKQEDKKSKQDLPAGLSADKAGKAGERVIPEIRPGMTIKVYQKIKELNPKGEEKERVQYFEGIIIAKKHGKQAGATITVRKVTDGVGVEKIFPLNLPTITKIEIKKQARVRRTKLYYLKRGYKKKLKDLSAKKASKAGKKVA
jgi:large subunit ribosomal protein L19